MTLFEFIVEDAAPSSAVSNLAAFHRPDPQLLLLLLIQLLGESLRGGISVMARKFVSTDSNFRFAEFRRERVFDTKDPCWEGLVAPSGQGEVEVRCGGWGDSAGRLVSVDRSEFGVDREDLSPEKNFRMLLKLLRAPPPLLRASSLA